MSSPFYVAQLLLGLGPAQECINMSETTILKKTDYPSHSSYQMPIIPQLGVWFHAYLLTHPGLSVTWVWAHLTCCHSHCEFRGAIALLCLESHFLEVISHPWLLQSAPHSVRIPSLRRGHDIDVPLRAEHLLLLIPAFPENMTACA